MPKQRTEDQLLELLLHELAMNPDITEAVEAEAVDYARTTDCFTCGLIQWVHVRSYDFSFGPELCLANELKKRHAEPDGDCLLRIEQRRERALERLAQAERTHHEAMFRLRRATQFHQEQAATAEARIAGITTDLRDGWGYESGVPQ